MKLPNLGDSGAHQIINEARERQTRRAKILKEAVVISAAEGGVASGQASDFWAGKTACWMCWKHQYYDTRPPAEAPPSHGVFAPGCNQPTFTGTTYEVGMVANLTSWIAVETLLAGEPGRNDLPGDYVLWIGRDETGAPAFKTEVLPVLKREKCRWCSK